MLFAATHPAFRRNVYAPVSRSFERFMEDARSGSRQGAAQYSQDDTSFQLVLDMPGVNKSELSIAIDGAVVRISTRDGAARSYRAAYELPQDIDAALSEARLENGVLTLKLAKKVPVNTATELQVQ